jgi:hypothetical protein
MTVGTSRTLMNTSLVLMVTVMGVLVGGIVTAFAVFSAELGGAYLIAIGFICSAIICGSFSFRKYFDVLEPMTLTAISIFIGGTLRSVYIAFLPSTYSQVNFLIGNTNYVDLAIAEASVPLSLLLFVVGYLAWKKRISIQRYRPFRTEFWPVGRTYLAVIILTLVGAASTVILIKEAGVSFASLATLSEKRNINLETVPHAGLLRWFVECLNVATLILYTQWACRQDADGRFKKFGIIRWAVLLVMVLLCMVWPIISSSRTDVIEIILAIMVVHVYLRQRGSLERFLRLSFLVLGFALVVLVGMGLWRNLAQRGKVSSDSYSQLFVDQAIGSGNFFPVERTGYIITHYQNQKFLDGTTYLAWLTAPIPKSEWPDRPDMSLGPMVKEKIYQRPTPSNGYPPGMLGEAYMNFSYLGLIVMPLLLGALMKFVYLTFKPLLGVNKNATVMYASILWFLGFYLTDSNFSMFMINVIAAIIPLLVFFCLMEKPKFVKA